MPEFMDVHTGMVGITPENLKEAHQADQDIQDDEGVNVLAIAICSTDQPARRRRALWGSPSKEG